MFVRGWQNWSGRSGGHLTDILTDHAHLSLHMYTHVVIMLAAEHLHQSGQLWQKIINHWFVTATKWLEHTQNVSSSQAVHISLEVQRITRCIELYWKFHRSAYCKLIRSANKLKRLSKSKRWLRQRYLDGQMFCAESYRHKCCRMIGQHPKPKPRYVKSRCICIIILVSPLFFKKHPN